MGKTHDDDEVEIDLRELYYALKKRVLVILAAVLAGAVIAGAAVFFAVFRSLANIADSTVLSHLGLSKNIYNMMPFIASMIILAFTSKNSQAPKAEGIPYDKGAR